jgi:hypothetical protein
MPSVNDRQCVCTYKNRVINLESVTIVPLDRSWLRHQEEAILKFITYPFIILFLNVIYAPHAKSI